MSGVPPSRDGRADVADDVRRGAPWARSIKQRVMQREMPPWHIDRTQGIQHYKNDRSLSDAEIATIVKWVDAGAPEGDPRDLPPPVQFRNEDEWTIGKPDLIVTSPDACRSPQRRQTGGATTTCRPG